MYKYVTVLDGTKWLQPFAAFGNGAIELNSSVSEIQFIKQHSVCKLTGNGDSVLTVLFVYSKLNSPRICKPM